MKIKKHYHRLGLYCPVCNANAFYMGDISLIEGIKYHITLHCNNPNCRTTFRLQRKEKQEAYFKKHYFINTLEEDYKF